MRCHPILKKMTPAAKDGSDEPPSGGRNGERDSMARHPATIRTLRAAPGSEAVA
jgi:hypothetical protein